MPELPEIEHLRRTLEGVILQGTVRRVRLLRADILHRPNGTTTTPTLQKTCSGTGHSRAYPPTARPSTMMNRSLS